MKRMALLRGRGSGATYLVFFCGDFELVVPRGDSTSF